MGRRFKILAGSKWSKTNKHRFTNTHLVLCDDTRWWPDRIPRSDIQSIEVKTEEEAHRIARTAGWGVAGALVAGPLGAIAGGWFGGKRKDVTFCLTLKDGTQFIALTDARTFNDLSSPLMLDAMLTAPTH